MEPEPQSELEQAEGMPEGNPPPEEMGLAEFLKSCAEGSDDEEAAADAIKSIKHDEDELEVAHALYSYICCALVKESTERVVPRCLARGFCAVSRRLGRRPMLDYSGCVLYNWALLDEKGPVDMNNARMLRRFTGETRRLRDVHYAIEPTSRHRRAVARRSRRRGVVLQDPFSY